tara:strand:- start:177 stop:395 length:219 start_codon:yes stop_codon:yes gene_type:complete
VDVEELDNIAKQAFIKSVSEVVIDFMSVCIFDIKGVSEFVEDFMSLFPLERFDEIGSASDVVVFFEVFNAGR